MNLQIAKKHFNKNEKLIIEALENDISSVTCCEISSLNVKLLKLLKKINDAFSQENRADFIEAQDYAGHIVNLIQSRHFLFNDRFEDERATLEVRGLAASKEELINFLQITELGVRELREDQIEYRDFVSQHLETLKTAA